MKWSNEQNAIFAWFGNPAAHSRALVVRARAGTGKTTTIKAAFEHAPEPKMLYAVFNKKNQVEAAAKIRDPRVEVKTLHALGFRYLKRQWPNCRPDDRVEFDRVDAVARGLSDDDRSDVRKLVGLAKNMLACPTVDDLVKLADDWMLGDEENVRVLARAALAVLNLSLKPDAQGRISFNDMVWLPVAAKLVRPWFDLVVVDEAQDMNALQLAMARGACRRGGRVCVVGDDRQAIYGFRGADSQGMARMALELDAEELSLCVTFRCPKQVVELAQQDVPDYRAADGNAEGVVESCSENAMLARVEAGDAILSRANAPLMPLCLALLRKGVPAMIEGRDVGKQLAGIVAKFKARSVPHLFQRVESWQCRMRARFGKLSPEEAELKLALVDDQAETIKAIAEGAASVREVLERLESMFKDSEREGPMVVLSSVHKAKGLEWDRVFMLRSTFKKRPGLEEDNIHYVAVTRAKRELCVVSDK